MAIHKGVGKEEPMGAAGSNSGVLCPPLDLMGKGRAGTRAQKEQLSL